MILNKEIKHYTGKNIYDIICNKPITESESINVGYNTFVGVIIESLKCMIKKVKIL